MERLIPLLLLCLLIGNVASMKKPGEIVEDEELLDDEFDSSERQDYQQVDPKPKLQSPVQPGPVEHLKPLPPFGSSSHAAPPSPPPRSPPPPTAAAPPPSPPSKPDNPTVPISTGSSSSFPPSPSGGSTIITPPP
ncbi:sulfated surface glycoprotein 185-like [Selaginella moellendorffii]|uniref:sulfated surface glycoprotein 185-like n=1 Tax=Selaginella moellendorffii TaxID=88036 RepID=UPI000D1CB33C|nr:sulfated surface glycoprotein 185-like [Selaginella moellendorffii]XP_024528422.1 sulfated surface glycoprotein 185-like [Selaginella moellendorffii]|eukprot:XP_024528421.1 sulfated surface glycoprotein 185-like [Selaginella moellendorffii]